MVFFVRRAVLYFPRTSSYVVCRRGFVAQQRFITTSWPHRQAVEEAQQEERESLNDAPIFVDDDTTQVDWSRSFHGLSSQPFSEEVSKVLTAPIDIDDVEIKPGSTNSLSY